MPTDRLLQPNARQMSLSQKSEIKFVLLAVWHCCVFYFVDCCVESTRDYLVGM